MIGSRVKNPLNVRALSVFEMDQYMGGFVDEDW